MEVSEFSPDIFFQKIVDIFLMLCYHAIRNHKAKALWDFHSAFAAL